MIIVEFTCLIWHSLPFIDKQAVALKKAGLALYVPIDRESHTNAAVWGGWNAVEAVPASLLAT